MKKFKSNSILITIEGILHCLTSLFLLLCRKQVPNESYCPEWNPSMVQWYTILCVLALNSGDRSIDLELLICWLQKLSNYRRVGEFSETMATLQNKKTHFAPVFVRIDYTNFEMEVTSLTVFTQVINKTHTWNIYCMYMECKYYSVKITAKLRVHFRNSFWRHIHLKVVLL